MARRAGCGVAAKGGVIDGCCAAYTTSVTPVGVPASPQGEALGAVSASACKQQFSASIRLLLEALDFAGGGGIGDISADDAMVTN